MKIKILFPCILSIMFFIPSTISFAFEKGFPKLIWEKKYTFEIDKIIMADESGDVLLSGKTNAELILIDPKGNEVLHLGPNPQDCIMDIDISTNGEKLTYLNCWGNAPPIPMSLPAGQLHFIDRKGIELWNKDIRGYSILSPNASWYIVSDFANEEDGFTRTFDINNNLLWEKPNIHGIIFSSDSNYIISKKNANEQSIIFNTYNRHGELKWKGEFLEAKIGVEYFGISETAKGGYIVCNYGDYHKIYDCLGNVVTEIPLAAKKAFISPDGKAVLFQYESTFQVLNLPDKSLKIERNLNFTNAILSNKGKYLVGSQNLPKNIVIYDIQNQMEWKVKIDINIDYDRYNSFFYLTTDGKFLLIKEGEQQLYYYQLY